MWWKGLQGGKFKGPEESKGGWIVVCWGWKGMGLWRGHTGFDSLDEELRLYS